MATSASGEDFYRGRIITLFVDGAGTYKGYARLLADLMPKYSWPADDHRQANDRSERAETR